MTRYSKFELFALSKKAFMIGCHIPLSHSRPCYSRSSAELLIEFNDRSFIYRAFVVFVAWEEQRHTARLPKDYTEMEDSPHGSPGLSRFHIRETSALLAPAATAAFSNTALCNLVSRAGNLDASFAYASHLITRLLDDCIVCQHEPVDVPRTRRRTTTAMIGVLSMPFACISLDCQLDVGAWVVSVC